MIDKYQSTKGEQVILKKGSEVVGDLMEVPLMILQDCVNCNQKTTRKYLLVKGVGADGFVEIPFEILTKSDVINSMPQNVQTNGDTPQDVQTNSGTVVPAKNDNKDINSFLVLNEN